MPNKVKKITELELQQMPTSVLKNYARRMSNSRAIDAKDKAHACANVQAANRELEARGIELVQQA